jgi:hypothetical protein
MVASAAAAMAFISAASFVVASFAATAGISFRCICFVVASFAAFASTVGFVVASFCAAVALFRRVTARLLLHRLLLRYYCI